MNEFEDDPPVQERVAETLVAADKSLAVAESLTGGLMGVLLTGVTGAGGFFDRSLVTYTFEAKREELGVDRSVLEDVGDVNAVVAEQMARGVREAADTTWGLSTTGLAGPPDVVHDAPVGTVSVGVVRSATSRTGRSCTNPTSSPGESPTPPRSTGYIPVPGGTSVWPTTRSTSSAPSSASAFATSTRWTT